MRLADTDDDSVFSRSIRLPVSKTTSQIVNILKSRIDLPTAELVIQWIFLNLNDEAKKEINEIIDFLKMKPLFSSVKELREYCETLEECSGSIFEDALEDMKQKRGNAKNKT